LIAPKNTLAYQLKARPATIKRDISNVPMAVAMAQLNAFKAADTAATTKPEVDALTFYMLNHAVALTRARFDPEEPLGGHLAILEDYHSVLAPKIARMAYYLLLICARENRHLHNKEKLAPEISQQFSPAAADFMTKVPDEPNAAVSQICSNPPNCTIGQYVGALSYAFYNGSWSSAYGGKKWGVISDTLLKLIKGEWTPEMMMDTAFTLAHNTAPIFNKGMLYAHNGSYLLRILDVQRSGQIPQMIASKDHAVKSYITPQLAALHDKLATILGDEFRGHVDWFKVEALGAQGNYKKDQQAQAGGHDPAKTDDAYAAMLAEAQKKHKANQAKAKAEAMANSYEIMPGLTVKKINLIRPVAA
jgi:hypothetical protein